MTISGGGREIKTTMIGSESMVTEGIKMVKNNERLA